MKLKTLVVAFGVATGLLGAACGGDGACTFNSDGEKLCGEEARAYCQQQGEPVPGSGCAEVLGPGGWGEPCPPDEGGESYGVCSTDP